MTYAQNIYDSTLDRSYQYDQVGRLAISHSGAEARAHAFRGQWGTMDGPYSHGYEYDVFGNMTHRHGWGGEVQGGSAGQTSHIYTSFTNNRRNGFSYDAAGNLTNDGGQTFTYDATGQQATASYLSMQQYYDGNGLRMKKTENGTATWYLRSSVLGGQVIAEMNASGAWTRGYVYAGSGLLAVQQQNSVNWMHEDPVTKSKRVTDASGTLVSTVELDPWGGDTNRSSNAAFQPKQFTSYERDANGSDEAMFRRYNRWHSRFDQPDPYDGSYALTNPQTFNRYSYTQNDPVNFVDPTGTVCVIIWLTPTHYFELCDGSGDSGGGGAPWTRDDERGGGGGGGGVHERGHGPQKTVSDVNTPNDCYAFANKVAQIAAQTRVDLAGHGESDMIDSFMDKLATTFTEFTSADALGMLGSREGFNLNEYNDVGFRAQLQDHTGPGATPNQVRHAVGGLIMGYVAGNNKASRKLMDLREDMSTPSGQADTRLNRITMPMGAKTRTSGAAAAGLANWIKRNLCEPLTRR